MPPRLVTLDVVDRVAVVTLRDPDHRNMLSGDLVTSLVGMLDFVEVKAGIGAIVVTGEPPAFCSGADISQLGSVAGDGLRRIYEGFLRVARCPLPTIAAVNGPAVGAGLNLALACDLRIAGASARFDSRFLQLGLHPGGGHTWMLRRIAGPQVVNAMVLFGEVLDSVSAERLGLVYRSVPDDELLDTAISLAQRAAAAPTELATRTKSTIGEMANVETHDAAVDRELNHQEWSLAQPWFNERVGHRPKT